MATLTHTAVEKKKGPARPSNAWILYRKHKSQTLPPPPPGAPRRPQADASKIIASMWRSEPLHIRAEWERRAEEEKAKHKMIYPDYKFNPESKEKKEARKALKAQQKEIARANKRGRGRTQPYVIPVPAMPPSGPSHTSHVDPVAYYGECGPSPHLSAAPSPVSGGSSIIPLPPSQQYPQLYPPHSPSESSSGSDAYQNVQNREVHSSTSLDMYGNPMPPNQSPMPLLPAQQQVYAQPHLPQPIDYQSQQHNQPQQDTYQGEIPPWTHTPSNDGQVTLPGLSAEDFASYQQMANWAPTNVDNQQAIAFSTGDPTVFTLEGVDWSSLLSNPSTEIEVSMGAQQPFNMDMQAMQYQQFANVFTSFDTSHIEGVSSTQTAYSTSGGPSRAISPVQNAASPAFFSNAQAPTPFSHSSSSASPPAQGIMTPVTPSYYTNTLETARTTSGPSVTGSQQSHPSFGQEAYQQYFNFDDSIGPLDTSPTALRTIDTNPSPPRIVSSSVESMMTPVSQGSSPTQHAAYAPPPGAAHVGTRRVAASWKPPRPEPDSPIGDSSGPGWQYPAISTRS